MSISIKFVFMSIIVLGLIVNTASFSDLAFADKPDKEKAKEAREEAKEAREEAKEAREEAKEAREEYEEEAKEAREEAKEEREDDEDMKEFSDLSVVTSSSTPSGGKITICHIPPGNPANAHTITVGSPAVRAHSAHGDFTEGPCESKEFNAEDYKSKKESRLSESSDKKSNALVRADQLIEKLEQRISNLEKRLQSLLEKYESGEYYGNISTSDVVTNSYLISFEGIASSIYDKDETTEMSGELFMENQVTTSNTSKFKITSGEIVIGNNIYDVIFGKARGTSSGQLGEENSLVIILQTMDSEENYNTVRITLGFDEPNEGEFGSPSGEFKILDNSKVSGQWILDGSGQFSLES